MVKININDNIKLIRVSKGLKQTEVAEKLNISPQGYQAIESGKASVTFERLQELAEIFGMSSVVDIINYPNVVALGNSEEIERLKKENEKLKNYLLDMSDLLESYFVDVEIALEMFEEIEEGMLKHIFDVALDELAKDEKDKELQEIYKIAKTYEAPLDYFHENYMQARKIQGKLLRILNTLLPK
jgi:transcriptional regulator with XRE-family HTH domain